MKSLSLIIALVSFPLVGAPLYVSKEIYPELKATLGTPPAMNSAEQKEDERILIEFSKKRSAADCKKAQDIIYLNLQTAFVPLILKPEEQTTLKPFFDKIRDDVDFFLVQLKAEYSRPRPYRTIKEGFKVCISKELTSSFPSGHPDKAELYTMVLSEIYPERKTAMAKNTAELMQIELLAGVHYPTDQKAGKEIAKVLFSKLMQSKEFKAELATYKYPQINPLAR